MASDRPDRAVFAANLALLKNLAMSSTSSFRLDEGYSEETRSQSGSDMVFRTDSNMDEPMDHDTQQMLPDWFLAMSEDERTECTYALLRGLRNSSIAHIVDRLHPLLHLDPVLRLPSEIMFTILRHLEPRDLLRASQLSKTWRVTSLDSELWRNLFRAEGWNSDTRLIRAFEAAERARARTSKGRKTRLRPSSSDTDSHVSKKRAPDRHMAAETSLFRDPDREPRLWGQQQGQVEVDGALEDEKMEDVTYSDSSSLLSSDDSTLPCAETPTDELHPPVKSQLMVEELGKDAKLNWQFLYKQKKRLEENWNAGHFTNFQFPHPAHPEEAHSECIYTIQHSSKHLVSGSRDHTIKIWDIDTQRLKKTLKGHGASVLCLQFDERPEHDLVASGGSDCHVFLWQFSTGRLVQKIEQAHAESVLNLRFDDHFLVTCSKDKTIKVWNRRRLSPGDADYPSPLSGSGSARYPAYIIDANEMDQAVQPLREFSLLMTLVGHTAAVNAIQVLDGQIVSASGDRAVKVWDIKSGMCVKTVTGHLKGIACVQYDGRRIVSGSSDDSVRVFDRATGAEVACLRGHENLVRTVQARFGDVAGSEEEQEAEARAVDHEFFRAAVKRDVAGVAAEDWSSEQRLARNNGSSDPRDICALGAKIPPGGGGTRWARIVSGSYDETVIIWKRNAKGGWAPAHRLNQLAAVINAGGRPRPVARGANVQQHLQNLAQLAQQAQAAHALAQQQGPANPQLHASMQQHLTAAGLVSGAAAATLHVASQTPAQQSLAATAGPLSNHAPAASSSSTGGAASSFTTPTVQSLSASAATAATLQSQQHGGNRGGSAQAPYASSSHTDGATPSSAPSTGITAAQIAAQYRVLQAARQAHQSGSLVAQPSSSSSSSSGFITVAQQAQLQQAQAHQHLYHYQHQHQHHLQHQLQHPIHLQHQLQHLHQQQQQHPHAPPPPPPPPPRHPQQLPPAAAAAAAAAAQQQQQQQQQANNPHGHHHHHHHHHHHPPARPAGTNSRVFKLQFDSRRIICCSQDPTIVGWDFANGDQDIVAASRFFGEEM